MTKRCLIQASPEQLRSVNIYDTWITNCTATVVFWNGLLQQSGICSLCERRSLNGSIDQYWIPTKWLKFIDNF